MLAWVRSADLELPEKDPPVTDLVEEGVRQRGSDWETVEEAVDRLQALDSESDDPFFLKVGFTNPHPGGGYRTTPEHLRHIPADEVTVTPEDPLDHPVTRKASIAKNTFDPLPDDEIREIRRHYLGMIRETDAMVGQVLDAIDEQGLREETVVVFISDHGDMQLEHRMWLKNSMYEASARVPFIVAGPGIESDHRVEMPVSLVSLRRTLADVCGYEPLEATSGRTLRPGLAGHQLPPEPILCEYHSNMQCTGSFMLRVTATGNTSHMGDTNRSYSSWVRILRRSRTWHPNDRMSSSEWTNCFWSAVSTPQSTGAQRPTTGRVYEPIGSEPTRKSIWNCWTNPTPRA